MKKTEEKERQRKRLEDLRFRQHKRAITKRPQQQPTIKTAFKTSEGKTRKKFDFSHMKAAKYADIRKYIAVPGTKEANMTADELRNELNSEASALAKPQVRSSTLLANMSLVKKFDSLMEELGEENIPTPHRALMFMGWLKRQKYSISYISKGLTCLKYHPKLQEEYHDIATHPDVRNALANLRKNVLHTEDNRIPLTKEAVLHFEKIMDKDFSANAALTMKMGIWLGVTCMLRLGELVHCRRTQDDGDVHTIPFEQVDFDSWLLSPTVLSHSLGTTVLLVAQRQLLVLVARRQLFVLIAQRQLFVLVARRQLFVLVARRQLFFR